MLQIRNMISSDLTQLAKLIKEHASEINMMSETALTAEYLAQQAFDRNPPSFKCNIVFVRNDGKEKLIGYMIYFDIYSTWVGKTMMVDDMYIKREYIDDKYLKGFINLILNDAKDNGYNRLEFSMMANDLLTDYHLSKGATNLGDSDLTVTYSYKGEELVEPERWLSYRLPKEVMQKMARNAE